MCLTMLIPYHSKVYMHQKLHLISTCYRYNILYNSISSQKSTRLSHQVRYQNQNLVYELDKYLKMVLTSLMNCDSILA